MLRNDDFDKQFRSMKRFAIGAWAFALILNLLILSGIGWVIYRLLQHFAII